MIWSALLVGLLGLVVGTVVVHLAEAVLARRGAALPHCPFCASPLPPLQWNALLSLVTGRARCAQCHHFLRVPRLLGELFVAVSWGLIAWRFGLRPRSLFAMAALIPCSTSNCPSFILG